MSYNGHKNWNYWNVSLWISNDEGLYRLAQSCKQQAVNTRDAAVLFVHSMEQRGVHKTPDGAVYTVNAVRAAMRGL